tara:strand:+ start:98 stop:478 length:381 start_codon:yes stop_codon:yes gene_type:complete
MYLTTQIINDLFNDDFAIRRMNQNLSSNHKVEHDDDGATITLDVPGYNKNLIDVSVACKQLATDGDLLVIEGKSNSGNTDGFIRKFNLGDSYDADGIEASVVDGVLTLSIPYVEEVKPKQVKVKVK